MSEPPSGQAWKKKKATPAASATVRITRKAPRPRRDKVVSARSGATAAGARVSTVLRASAGSLSWATAAGGANDGDGRRARSGFSGSVSAASGFSLSLALDLSLSFSFAFSFSFSFASFSFSFSFSFAFSFSLSFALSFTGSGADGTTAATAGVRVWLPSARPLAPPSAHATEQ